MKLNTGAMLKAFGIGLVGELVMVVISEVVNTASGATAGASPEQMLSSGAAGIGLGLSCVIYLMYGGIGAIYAWFARKDQGTIDAGSAALGGGITAVIVSIIGTVVSTLYGLLSGTMTKTIEQATSQVGGQTDALMPIVIGSLVIGFCIAFVLSAGFGAGGGAIYAAIAGRGQPQGTAPSV